MKKYLFLMLSALLIVSCSKKDQVIVSGVIKNVSPLDRIELINASSPTTLPVANIGVDANGKFSDTIAIAEDGLYAITVGRNMNFVYLKKGEHLNITADGADFSSSMKVEGDGEKNNAFLAALQKYMTEYLGKVDVQFMSKDEKPFLDEVQKMDKDMEKKIDELKSKFSPDSDLVKLKKDEAKVNLLMLMEQYANIHGQATGNPNYKPSLSFNNIRESLVKNEVQLVKEIPTYRSYLLMKYKDRFDQFVDNLKNKDLSATEAFAQFINKEKGVDQEVKDQLLAFVAMQYDMSPQNPRFDQMMATLDKEVKNPQIKKDLKEIKLVMQGLPKGTKAPDEGLVTADGKAFQFSMIKDNRPTVLIFYTSWTPYVNEALKSINAELNETYANHINTVIVNLDDTQDQFKKTSDAVLKDLKNVQSVYAKGGLKSKVAKAYGIYGFKLPCIVVVDKDGKIVSASYVETRGDGLEKVLTTLTGIQPKPKETKEESQPSK
ncbi:TlpA family protein disulfide reductase [Riemerella columbina]|uniref:TlpA family protein disulfide reductase n=1 Tax=Riemerella columbina TaxID=103810 RepID=UPI000525604D|nr:redoxin domain-containing protein [Riemerella columbina]